MIAGLITATAFAQDAVLLGTDGNDAITGTAAGEAIYGRAGNDAINGAGGDDELDGGPGADTLSGGPGADVVSYDGVAAVAVSLDDVADDGVAGEGDNVRSDVEDVFGGDGSDKLVGNAGANTIDGGGGDDRITGGRGPDALFGGSGDDVIDARDRGPDRVECGAGRDLVTADREDVLDGDCERRLRQRVTITPGLTLAQQGGVRRMIITNIVQGSRVVVACLRGCRPPSPPTRALIARSAVRLTGQRAVRLPLPQRIAGATIELGVRAPGARATCVRYRIASDLRSFRTLRQACTTVARS